MKKAFSDELPCDGWAFEGVSILAVFLGLEDPRQAGKVVYPLVEVLTFVLLAVMSGADAFTEVEHFGNAERASIPCEASENSPHGPTSIC